MSGEPVFPVPLKVLRPLTIHATREIWLVRDERLDRLAVAKRLPVGRPQGSGEALMAAVRHPLLVDIYGVVSARGQEWLISEFVDGRALDSGDQLWPPCAVLHTVADLCEGLQALAAAGLVHADVSPGNVMVDASGQLRLIDFTQSLAVGTPSTGAGTPGFAPPEIVHCRQVTATTDVWSMAAVGIWMMSGQSPGWVVDDEGVGSLVIPAWRPPDTTGALLRDCLISVLRAAPEQRPDARELGAEMSRLRQLFALEGRSDLRAFVRSDSDAGAASQVPGEGRADS